MTPRGFLYIVAATDRPDQITCRVPWKVSERAIVFGPCKKRLREELRKLLGIRKSATPPSPILLVGFSPSNPRSVRRVLWAGRITRLMTFAEAYARLDGPTYADMLRNTKSPLHVKPVVVGKRVIGYEHRSKLHAKEDEWILDLVKTRRSRDVRLEGRRLLIRNGLERAEAFPRDVCAVCDNLFFARGREGLIVDDELVGILRRAQPGVDIDRYAIFGYRKDGSADGKTGSYVEVSGHAVEEIIAWIADRARTARTLAPARHAPVRC